MDEQHAGELRDNEPWDVIIVGAGLAGTVIATRLADAGRRVLLVEAKRFPRPKTCGGCLNERAIAGLQEAGFGGTLRSCEPAAIDTLDLRGGGQFLRVPLPPGLAVTRETLDLAMICEAQRRGVEVLTGVRARVHADVADGLRTVILRSSGGELGAEQHTARLVIACDGLGHPSLTDLPEFDAVVAPNSRAGVGGVIADPSVADTYPRGTITMAVQPHGYVGLAICEQNRLNIAAAFDPPALRGATSGQAVNHVLEASGLPAIPDADEVAWRGSPRLSQHSPRVAGERLLLLGDAAGYVEPFTGEGMASAIESANAATPIALRATGQWNKALADEWQSVYTRNIRRNQAACRAIAWMLKRPVATRIGLGAAAMAPAIGRAVAAKVSAG